MRAESVTPRFTTRSYRFLFNGIRETSRPRSKAEAWVIDLFGPAIDSGSGGYKVVWSEGPLDEGAGYILDVVAWAADESLLP